MPSNPTYFFLFFPPMQCGGNGNRDSLPSSLLAWPFMILPFESIGLKKLHKSRKSTDIHGVT